MQQNRPTLKLFENNKKSKDVHPDYTGKLYDEKGTEYYVSCWIKETKSGSNYLSGQIKLASEAKAEFGKERKEAKKINRNDTVHSSGDENLDDDLPF